MTHRCVCGVGETGWREGKKFLSSTCVPLLWVQSAAEMRVQEKSSAMFKQRWGLTKTVPKEGSLQWSTLVDTVWMLKVPQVTTC